MIGEEPNGFAQLTPAAAMTLIEIRPHRWGRKVFEALHVEPVFLEKYEAMVKNKLWQ